MMIIITEMTIKISDINFIVTHSVGWFAYIVNFIKSTVEEPNRVKKNKKNCLFHSWL